MSNLPNLRPSARPEYWTSRRQILRLGYFWHKRLVLRQAEGDMKYHIGVRGHQDLTYKIHRLQL